MGKIDLVKLKHTIESNEKLDDFDAEVIYNMVTNSSRLYLSYPNKIYNEYTLCAIIYENGTMDVFNESCDLLRDLEYENIVNLIISNIEQAIENAESFYEDVRSAIGKQ